MAKTVKKQLLCGSGLVMYGRRTICSGAYLYNLDNALKDDLAEAVVMCPSCQALLVVSGGQWRAKKALRELKRGKRLVLGNFFRFSVKTYPWSTNAKLVKVKATLVS